MTLTVEDGTGLSDADSYVSEADCTAYLALHYTSTQLTAWTAATSGDREIWIRNAAQYMVAQYRSRWSGERYLETQALDFPRDGMLDTDGFELDYDEVPQVVKDAQCELAFRASSAELMPDTAAASGNITSESKSGAGFSKSITYGSGGKPTQSSYELVSKLLAPFIVQGARVLRG